MNRTDRVNDDIVRCLKGGMVELNLVSTVKRAFNFKIGYSELSDKNIYFIVVKV